MLVVTPQDDPKNTTLNRRSIVFPISQVPSSKHVHGLLLYSKHVAQ